MWYINHYTLTL